MESIATNLELQLSELEMLRSMFPGEGELCLDDPAAEAEVNQWINGEKKDLKVKDGVCSPKQFLFPNNFCILDLPPILSFRLTLRMEDGPSTLEVSATLGRYYPASVDQLELHVKSDSFSRSSQADLNRIVKQQVEGLGDGELAVGIVVQWLQENWTGYCLKSCQEREKPDVSPSRGKSGKSDRFTRLWIYSHHIYSKTKRKNILELSSDFQLTGFCMPGKPGIICMEGSARNCAEAWSAIKSWNWKKINVKIQEEEENVLDLDKLRRFPDFQEIGFVKTGETRDYHMDMGEFFIFLKKYDSDYMFKEFFGIDKVS